MKKHILLIYLLLFCICICNSCELGDDIEVLDDGIISVKGHDILLVENTEYESDLWVVAGDRAGEAVGVLLDRSDTGNSRTLYGAVYVTPDGQSFTLMLDENGYPESITFEDNSALTITNYTENTADINYIDPDTGIALVTETIKLGDDFKSLQEHIATYGLAYTLSDNSTAVNRISSDGIHIYANEAHLFAIKGTLRVAGTAISVLACAGSTLSLLIPGAQPVSIPMTAAACASAMAGVISTVDYFADKTEAGDIAGSVSTTLSGGSYLGDMKDPSNLILFIMSIYEGMLPDCTVAVPQHHKGCIDDTLYWYNDCNILQQSVEHCVHGCRDGACLPFDPDLEVSIGADPLCAKPGDTVFFSSTVTGGDSSTYTYLWDFGDASGAEYNIQSASHTFPDAGTYSVSLTVEDDSGNRGYGQTILEVGDCEELRAGISSSPACVETGKNIRFTAEAIGGDKGSYTYSWNLGDGTMSTRANPVHSYAYENNYTVTLTVRDKNNLMDRVETVIQVGGCKDDYEDPTDPGSSTTTTTIAEGPDLSGFTCAYLVVQGASSCNSPDDGSHYYAVNPSWGGGDSYGFYPCPPQGYGSCSDNVFSASCDFDDQCFNVHEELTVYFSYDISEGLTISRLTATKTKTPGGGEASCLGITRHTQEITASNIPCTYSSSGVTCGVDSGDVAGYIDSFSSVTVDDEGVTSGECSQIYNDYTLIENEFFHDRTPAINFTLHK